MAKSDQLRVPVLCSGVATLHSLLDLQQRMLYVTGVLFVSEILRDFGVGEFAAKPGEVPRKKSRSNKERGQDQNRARARSTNSKHVGKSDKASSRQSHR